MGTLKTLAVIAGSTALSIGLATGVHAASETWASSSAPLKATYNGATLGQGYGTLFTQPTGGTNYFNLNDIANNGLATYGLSSIEGHVRTTARTNSASSAHVYHNWPYTTTANGFIRIGEDAPWRPDILSESLYISVPTS